MACTLLLPLLTAMGCVEEAMQVPFEPPVHSDSAGVTVSVFTRGLPQEAVRLNRTEILIGEDEGRPGHLLHQVRGIRELSDGTIALLDAGSREVRLFDPEGELLGRFGRSGEGPQELAGPTSLSLLGADSIGVVTRGAEFRVFSRDGSFGRAGRIAPGATDREPPAPPGGAEVTLHGILGTGGLVVGQLHRSADEPEGLIRDTVELAVHEDGDRPAVVLGRFPVAERIHGRYGETNGAVIREELPFARPTLVAVGGRETVVGRTDGFELRVFDERGRLQRLIRLVRPEILVTDEVMEAFIEVQIGRMRVDRDGVQQPLDPDLARRYRENRRAIPRVPSLPHFDRLVLASSGSIWIRDYVVPHSEPGWVRWWEIRPDGETGRTLELPEGFTLMEISTTHLLGVLPDQVDVERVVRYALPEE